MAKRQKLTRRFGTFVPADGHIELGELDIAVLRLLPRQGAKVGKYLPDALTAVQVKTLLDDANHLTGSMIGGRLRWLRAGGYAEPVKMLGAAAGNKGGWQRTRAGDKLLREIDGSDDGESETPPAAGT
jgi:hypothetical protein